MKRMKASAPAETPKFVLPAFWVNLGLGAVAVVAPRMIASTDTAAILFTVPMTAILVVGASVAIWCFVLARREYRSVRWTAFLPLSVFLLGLAGTLAMVQTDALWEKTPTEYKTGPR